MRGLDVLFHSDSYSFCASVPGAAASYTVKPCSCNCTRHIFAFLILPPSTRVILLFPHVALFLLKSFSLSVFLVFVRLDDAIPRDQKRIRFATRDWSPGEGSLTAKCGRPRIDGAIWFHYARNAANTIYEIIFLQWKLSRCGIPRIGRERERATVSLAIRCDIEIALQFRNAI